MTVLQLPPDALVLLIGAAGSGKSTLAARHFAPDEVLSSDAFRAAVSGDPLDQSATPEAFRRLHAALDGRLAAGQLTVVDATNVQGRARRRLLATAARHGRPTVGIVLALPLDLSLQRNAGRTGARVPDAALRRQDADLRRSLPLLPTEGFAAVVTLEDPGRVDRLRVKRLARMKTPGPRSGRNRGQRNVPKERHPTL